MLVADVGVGPQLEQRAGEGEVAVSGRDVERGVPGLVAGDVAAAECADVEARPSEQRDGVGRALGRGPGDQAGPPSSYQGDDLGGSLLHGFGVTGENGCDEGVGR